ncbi:hypothetical protein B14911_04299 [Bacillus sp. NRRL B-14911]|nr:hypothetical protein B14911_04299 [Bacillus sp. NRRL B-14911]
MSNEVEKEWIELLLEARNVGLTLGEVESFFRREHDFWIRQENITETD